MKNLLLLLLLNLEACAAAGDTCVGPSCNPPRLPDSTTTLDSGHDARIIDAQSNMADTTATDTGPDGPRDATLDSRDSPTDVRLDGTSDVALDTPRDVRIDVAMTDVLEAAVDSGTDAAQDTGPRTAELCDTANEGGSVSLTCPRGLLIRQVIVASFGSLSGTCPDIAPGSCHASSSSNVVRTACIGQSSCSVRADNGLFVDPCVGTVKRLGVRVICSP